MEGGYLKNHVFNFFKIQIVNLLKMHYKFIKHILHKCNNKSVPDYKSTCVHYIRHDALKQELISVLSLNLNTSSNVQSF